jgi:hypothetical protein
MIRWLQLLTTWASLCGLASCAAPDAWNLEQTDQASGPRERASWRPVLQRHDGPFLGFAQGLV